MNRIVLTWEQIDDACGRLARLLRNPKPSAIVAVLRGGLVPATILSYALGAPIVDVVDPRRSSTYRPGRDLLVVDDVCDTGATLEHLRSYFPNARFAALYTKPIGEALCSFVVHPFIIPVPQDTWITFPWSPNDHLE